MASQKHDDVGGNSLSDIRVCRIIFANYFERHYRDAGGWINGFDG